MRMDRIERRGCTVRVEFLPAVFGDVIAPAGLTVESRLVAYQLEVGNEKREWWFPNAKWGRGKVSLQQWLNSK